MKRTWCIGSINAEFIAKMEQILWLYQQKYDPLYPVICFDERPCFLIGNIIEPIALQSGKVSREHYGYEKNGSCALLAAIEPKTGKRIAQVHHQRTKLEYTLFFQALALAYPDAKKIRVVQDNLNTHSTSSFYQHLPADEAFALAQRFEFFYTPKSASWLNMIEIEFSALSKLCLDRRIPSLDKLKREVLSIVNERNDKNIKINWQFSLHSARHKLSSHYQKVFSGNSKYLIT